MCAHNTNTTSYSETDDHLFLYVWDGRKTQWPQITGSAAFMFQVYSSTDDYLGIGVRNGKVQVVVSLGYGSMTVLITDVRVDDGQWHSLDLNR